METEPLSGGRRTPMREQTEYLNFSWSSRCFSTCLRVSSLDSGVNREGLLQNSRSSSRLSGFLQVSSSPGVPGVWRWPWLSPEDGLGIRHRVREAENGCPHFIVTAAPWPSYSFCLGHLLTLTKCIWEKLIWAMLEEVGQTLIIRHQDPCGNQIQRITHLADVSHLGSFIEKVQIPGLPAESLFSRFGVRPRNLCFTIFCRRFWWSDKLTDYRDLAITPCPLSHHVTLLSK